jgi:hypothetical protein
MAGDWCHRINLTSMGPWRTWGMVEATRMASFRFRAMMKKSSSSRLGKLKIHIHNVPIMKNNRLS